MLPLAGEGGNSALSIPGTNTPLFEHALGNIRTVNSDYFRTMGMSLQSGRLFTDADRDPSGCGDFDVDRKTRVARRRSHR